MISTGACGGRTARAKGSAAFAPWQGCAGEEGVVLGAHVVFDDRHLLTVAGVRSVPFRSGEPVAFFGFHVVEVGIVVGVGGSRYASQSASVKVRGAPCLGESHSADPTRPGIGV